MPKLIAGVAQVWPRMVFEQKAKGKYLAVVKSTFHKKPGIYILYNENNPYYIGKTENLFHRLAGYARNPNIKHYNSWTHFTAFIVEKHESLSDLEAILIRAIPSANGAKPKIPRIKIPPEITKIIKRNRVSKN